MDIKPMKGLIYLKNDSKLILLFNSRLKLIDLFLISHQHLEAWPIGVEGG
jgi:hypothetical protein